MTPFLETVVLAVILLDLLLLRTWIVSVLGLLGFLGAYLWYRREAGLNARAASPLRDAMVLNDVKRLENRYSSVPGFQTPEERARSRPPLERAFYHLRYERVQRLLSAHARRARLILDAGCGFGVHTRYVQEVLKVPAVGMDLDHNKLVLAASRARKRNSAASPAFVTADASTPPFRPERFDCILMTEVLEHLLRPREGLAAAHALLAPRGTLLLTTPSRHDLAYTANPFRALEKVLSLVWDPVLPPYHHLHERREYDRRNPAPQYGMHYHFSHRELRSMLSDTGFETVHCTSFEVEAPPVLWIASLTRKDPERLTRWVGAAESILENIPLLRLLGQHLVLVARKK